MNGRRRRAFTRWMRKNQCRSRGSKGMIVKIGQSMEELYRLFND